MGEPRTNAVDILGAFAFRSASSSRRRVNPAPAPPPEDFSGRVKAVGGFNLPHPMRNRRDSRAARWPIAAVTACRRQAVNDEGAWQRSFPVNWLRFPSHGQPMPVFRAGNEEHDTRHGSRLPPCAWGERRAGSPVFMSG